MVVLVDESGRRQRTGMPTDAPLVGIIAALAHNMGFAPHEYRFVREPRRALAHLHFAYVELPGVKGG